MIYIFVFFLVASVFATLTRNFPAIVMCAICAFLLATFAALRGPDVASDFLVYEDWYSVRDLKNGFLKRAGLFEILYFSLNDFFNWIGIPFRFFVWVLAFGSVFVKLKIIAEFSEKNFVALFVSVFLYEASFYLLHDFTQIRVGVAAAFVFLALRALVHEKTVNFIFFIIVALGFHTSALLAVVFLLPLSGLKSKLIDLTLIFVLLAAVVFALLGTSLGGFFIGFLPEIDPRISLYVQNSNAISSEPANPFSVPALLLSGLVIMLLRYDQKILQMQEFSLVDWKIILIGRRAMLVGLASLICFYPVPEVALRLYEINIIILPIIAAVIFSKHGYFGLKTVILCWLCTTLYINVGRDAGLVSAYKIFFPVI